MSATSHPYGKALGCATVAFILALIALFTAYGPPGPNGVEAITYLGCEIFLPALITGWLARRSGTAWPFWKIALTYLAALIIVAIAAANGHRHKAA